MTNDEFAIEPRHDGFLFIVDAVKIAATVLPYELGNGFTIDRPEPNEIDNWIRPWAKAALAPFERRSQPNAAEQRYQGRWIEAVDHQGHTVEWLTSDQWRYYVIRYTDRVATREDWGRLAAMQQVTRLVEPELAPALHVSFGLFVETTNGIQVPSTSEISRRLSTEPRHSALPLQIPEVSEDTIASLAELLSHRISLQDRHRPIVRALEILEQSDDLKHNSPMWLLSQFVALEAALTHTPNPGDPTDSIGRQLRTSVPLLLRRSNELDLLTPIGISTSLDTTLKKLYFLRSRIAHGNKPWPDSGGSLDALINLETATKTIRLILKAVLRQALREPDLVCDLKGPKPS